MANKKLTELPEISNLNFDSTDLLYIVNSDGVGTSSKITYGNLAGTKINTISTNFIAYDTQNTLNLAFLSGKIDVNVTDIATGATGGSSNSTRINLLSSAVDDNTALTQVLCTTVEGLDINVDLTTDFALLCADVVTISAATSDLWYIRTRSLTADDGIRFLSSQVDATDFTDPTFVGDLSCAPLFIDASGPAVGIGKNFNSMSNSLFMLEVSGNIGCNLIAGREDYNALFLYSDPEAATNNHTTGGSRITLHANDAIGDDGGPVSNQIYYDARFHNFRSISANGNLFTINGETSAVDVEGALSKGSGSFKINHPLSSKKNTHRLVHSFIEGPQADNIYRGKVDLVSGSATVNIDTAAGMSSGTFVLLNRDIQCFSSNESGYTAVKASVTGNILTITAQDSSCTDTISWLVIGERQDSHMYNTHWTDASGKVIVEPLIADEPKGPYNQ